jgi:hypothetical protein
MKSSRISQIKKSVALSLLAFGVLASHSTQAQVLFNGSYSQNFDSMGATGTTAPTGWSVVSEAGANTTFAPANTSTPGTFALPNFTAGTLTAKPTLTAVATPSGQDSSGGYNFNVSSVTGVSGDQGLGSSPTGTAGTVLELSITNSTSSAINTLSLSYDIDRLTVTSNNNGGGAPNGGLEELPGYELYYNLTPSNNATWVNVSSLNPTIDAGTTGAVQVPNTVGVTTIPTTTLTLNGSWNAGATIAFAWFDDNAESPSPDQDIALNNVVVTTAVSTPEPSSIALGLIGGAMLAALVIRRRIA